MFDGLLYQDCSQCKHSIKIELMILMILMQGFEKLTLHYLLHK